MRSSVSYILSSGSLEPNMSHPDYEQFSHDHAALLVLVRPLGPLLRPHTFTRLFERIGRVSTVRVTDGAGHIRSILVRYVKEHPVENNDWGDFQTHRRLLGLITIGKYDSQHELNEICRVHESLKVKYTTTLYDSRCILIRPSCDPDSPLEPETSTSSTSSTTTSGADPPVSEDPSKDISPEEISALTNPLPAQEITHEQKVAQLLDTLRHSTPVPSVPSVPCGGSPSSSISELKFHTPSNFKTRALFYTENDPCPDLEQVISEYVSSLFWVLDGKRLERSREKLDKVPLLLAPFEKKDFVGLDMESRNNKKRCTGRITKNLGDLCLQAGMLQESLAYYASAAETLRSVNDWLWLGAAFEGLCAASALYLYPHLRGDNSTCSFHRNASLQEPSSASSTTHSTKQQHLMQLQVRSLEEEVLAGPKEVPTGYLPADDISRRYREAITHYSNYQNAGIIETEASFKAARISVAQNHPLAAASFLQNVVLINLTLSEQEKIQRFETLSELYTQIGFMRKAAFCQRLAATRYVSPQNPSPNWNQCYALMLQSFPGHKLTLDPSELTIQPPHQLGWPVLQIQLLSELVVAAKRMGHSALATRHMTFLLQTMWPHLSSTDQREFSVQLQSLSAQCEGAPVPLVLDSGLVIPPANLNNIPVCVAFDVCQLALSLKPRKIETEKSAAGPFLFTPINFGSLERKSNKPNSKMDFVWVENEPCYVTIHLLNPLPYELRVSNMRLLTSGVVFESLPESVVLPPNTSNPSSSTQPADSSLSSVSSATSTSLLSNTSTTSSSISGSNTISITLHGTPRENGDLELLGYSTHTLGVKSNCRLRYMPRPNSRAGNFLSQYNVEVIPSLPTMEVQTSASALLSTVHLPLSAIDEQVTGAVVASAAVTVYNGEVAHLTITFINISSNDIPVEMLDVSMTILPSHSHQHYTTATELVQQVFGWSQEELAAQLPLAPGESANLNIRIHTAPVLHHLVTDSTAMSLVPPGVCVNSPLSSLSMGGTGVCSGIPSRINSPVTVRTNTTRAGANTLVNASFRSTSSAQSHSSGASYNSIGLAGSTTIGTRSPMQSAIAATSGTINSHVLHGQLQVRYSGGPGLHTAAYCRLCAVHVVVETLPSLHVTNWDVLPSAEQPQQFYLVLDVANLTGHEMELEYTERRCMLVEAMESCRVPVPVDRCPLDKLQHQLQQPKPNAIGTTDVSNNSGYQQHYLLQQQNMYRSEVERICSEHITELVKLNWRLFNHSSMNHGTVSLCGISLTPAMLDVVRMSPLSWEVQINGERPRSSEPIQCAVGDCLAVCVRMRNCLGRSLRHLRAQLHLYQDYRNGTENRRLDTRLAVTGPSHLCVDCLQPDDVAEHSCSVLIFTPGYYKMDVHCTGSDVEQLEQMEFNIVQQQQQQLWKYMPAIELLVSA